jgi:hypothetical protein
MRHIRSNNSTGLVGDEGSEALYKKTLIFIKPKGSMIMMLSLLFFLSLSLMKCFPGTNLSWKSEFKH